jgi:hypothetical protein
MKNQPSKEINPYRRRKTQLMNSQTFTPNPIQRKYNKFQENARHLDQKLFNYKIIKQA